MKTQILAVVLAVLPAASWAVQGKSVSDQLVLGKDGVRIVVDSADMILESSTAANASYRVDFVSESHGLFSTKPSQKAYDGSTASYDRKTGVLNIHAEDGLTARTRITVPPGAALAVSIKNGKASIGARSGKTTVEMDNGLLSFDASKVPATSCYQLIVDNGLTRGRKGRICANPTAVFHLLNGIATAE
ncbi:MAG: hypothetical protein ACHQ2Z_12910 [Elusimicrobiota bacterium]